MDDGALSAEVPRQTLLDVIQVRTLARSHPLLALRGARGGCGLRRARGSKQAGGRAGGSLVARLARAAQRGALG